MAIDVPDLVGKVRLDTTGLDAAVGEASKKGTLIGSVLGTAIGGLAANGIGAALGALGSFVAGSAAAAEESLQVGQATDAILKATGGAAQVNAGHVGDLATRLSDLTGIDDELVQTGENMLLTFTNVKNQGTGAAAVFDRATGAALDLSKAGFGSVESASVMLGKALNDPAKGLTALSKVGVTFTAQQKDQVKALVASGDTLKAQQVILAAVEGQVGGVAAATANPMDRLKVAVGNVQESLGTLLLPVVGKVANVLVDDVIPGVEGFIGILGDLQGRVNPTLEPIAGYVNAVVDAFHDGDVTSDGLVGVLERVGNGARALVDFVSGGDFSGPLHDALTGILPGGTLPLIGVLEDARAGVGAFAGDVVATFQAVAGAIALVTTGDFSGGLFAGLGLEEDSPALDVLYRMHDALVDTAGTVALVIGAFTGAGADVDLPWMNTAIDLGAQLRTSFDQVVAAVQVAGPAIASGLAPAFDGIGAAVGILLPVVGTLAKIFTTSVLPVLTSVATFIIGTLDPAIAVIVGAIVGTVLPVVASWVAILATRLVPIFQSVAGFITGSLVPGLASFVGGVQRGVVAVMPFIEFLGRLVGVVLNVVGAIVGPLVGALLSFAGPVVKTLLTALGGVISVLGTVLGWVGRVGNSFLDAASSPAAFKKAVGSAVDGALGFISSLPGRIASALGSLGSLLLSAGHDLIAGLVKGVTGAVGSAVSAVKDVAGKVTSAAKAAFGIHSPSKVFEEIGVFLNEGLVVGLQGSADQVKGTVDKIADEISKGFTEKARATTEAQKQANAAVIDGYKKQAQAVKDSAAEQVEAITRAARGHKGGADAVAVAKDRINDAADAEIKKLDELIAKAQATGETFAGINDALAGASTAGLLGAIADEEAALSALADQRAAGAAELKDANEQLDAAIKLDMDFASKVQGNVLGLGELLGIDPAKGEDGKAIALDAQRIIDSLTSASTSVADYREELSHLASLGLSDELYRQLAEAGPIKGKAYADALLAGGADAIDQVNKLEEELASQAAFLGNETSDHLYGAGVRSMDGLVNGLQSQQARLQQVAQGIADTIANTIRAALDIHSPSRVMRRLGVFTGQGLSAGITDATPGAVAAASALAAGVASAGAATLPSPRRPAGSLSTAGPGADRPVINVRAYIGDTELRDLVRFEIDEDAADLAASV